jgi:hypothetical protein
VTWRNTLAYFQVNFVGEKVSTVMSPENSPQNGATTPSITTLGIMGHDPSVFMLSVIYAKCLMLGVTNRPYMLNVSMPSVVMLNVVAQQKPSRVEISIIW